MKHQMELILPAKTPATRRAVRRQRRLPSAHWWFDQMRKAVDEAMDWQPAPAARPAQTHLSLATGQAEVA